MAREIQLILPKLYPKQREAIYAPERYALTEASTKSGKTHGCIAWVIDKGSELKPGQKGRWIAPVNSQAKTAFDRLTRYLPPDFYTKNETTLTVKLINGGIIEFRSGEKPNNLYGEDVYFAVLDEASRMREETWFATRSTLTYTKGPVRFIGNVVGRKNWFYRMCRLAELGEPDYAYHKITAYDAVDAGVLSLSEIEDAKRGMPREVFKELYLAEPCDGQANPFGMEWISECTMEQLSAKDPICYGWDLAETTDWTVGIGLDEDARTCRFYRFQKPWPQTIKEIIRIVGDTPALLDQTGVGKPILEGVQEKCSNVEGYLFNQRSKQALMDMLAVAIQSEEIAFHDPVRKELEMFEYRYTGTGVIYSAMESAHDDIVCALALANYHFRTKGRMIDDVGFY